MGVADSEPAWTTVIGPSGGALDWRLSELWAGRELIALFVWRDFIALYKQTILGPLWHILQPLLTTLTYTLVFGAMVGIPTDNTPPFLFYLAGNLLWSLFAACLTKTATTLIANAALLGKVYFHRLVLPLSIVASAMLAFSIQAAVFLAVWLAYLARGSAIHPSPWLVAVPLAVLVVVGYGLCGGVIVSALTTRYRDVGVLVSFGAQLLMFATPVLYPASAVPPHLRWIIWLNPLASPLEVFRSGLLGAGTATVPQFAGSCLLLPPVLFVALVLFSRVDRNFMDTV